MRHNWLINVIKSPAALGVAVKTPIALVSLVAILATTGAAIAYWTTTGSGEAQLRTQNTAASFTVESGSEVSGLYPGGSKEANVEIRNVEPLGEVFKTLSAEVKEVENAASSEAEAESGFKCWLGWFEISEVGGHHGASFEFDETVLANSIAEHKVTLRMRELERNENGCLGKKVTLIYRIA